MNPVTSTSPAHTISVTSFQQTPRASRDFTEDHSFRSTTPPGSEHARSRSIPIPTIAERRSGQLHLDLPPPSTSFRDRISSESPWEGSSRLQRMAQGMKRFTPNSVSGGNASSTPAWSLFGDLMETDAQLQSLGTKRRKAKNIPESLHSSYASLRESESDPFLFAGEPFPTSSAMPGSDIPKHPTPSSPEHVGDDASESSESTSNSATVPNTIPHRWSFRQWIDDMPLLYRNILKCAFAYFLASLFTFHPYLSGLLSNFSLNGPGDRRPSPSGHMVATVAVYFNPAKTRGGMFEADGYCVLGLLYTAVISLCSMWMFWWLDVIPGLEWLAIALVLLWIGVGMSAVAWTKVWLNKPSFNPACSMIAIILFVVVVKEGGPETLFHVTSTVILGALVSNLVSFLVWPQSATVNLHANVTKTLDSFSTLIRMLTSTFLLETHPHQASYQKLQNAVELHQASFTTLKKNLAEAQSEWIFAGSEYRRNAMTAYQDAVDSLNRLAQHLNGLRGGTHLQYELIKAQRDGKLVLMKGKSYGKGSDSDRDPSFKGKTPEKQESRSHDGDEDQLLKEAAVMFGELVDDLGPPLKALSNVCTQSLNRLRDCLARGRNDKLAKMIEPDEFHQLAEGIERALFTFESTSNHAVMRLYRKSQTTSNIFANPGDPDNGGNDNEHVLLVYFFIFTLQEFARELRLLVDAMERIYDVELQAETRRGWWKTAVRWLAIIPAMCSYSDQKAVRPGLRKSISRIIKQRITRHKRSYSFPRIRPHAPNTIQTPARSDLTFLGRIKQTIWAIGGALKERNLKFAIKAGMATAMLAAPAFFDATRPIFTEYRGEWALISFFVVISPTIGATNFLSIHRISGTLSGAGVAAGIYTLFPDNPWVLSIFGFLFSVPCFYYIVATPQYATTGRIVLLAYNLTCLFCYNLRDVDISPLSIAFHRSVAVTAGVVWAALISRFWWPSEARRELSTALHEFCLNLGWLYTRLVTANSNSSPDARDYPPNHNGSSGGHETFELGTRTLDSIHHFMEMELHLQIKLIEIQGLLEETQHEPRLKGPFPVGLYRSILTSLQRILDKLHSMRCVTTREEWWTSVRHDFIIPVNKERREMVGNIILGFSTLASAFRLKAPLPPYLPPAEECRQRLVDAIRKLEIVKNRDVKGSKQLLFFAYALTMKGVTRELDYLGRTLQDAFGVIGQSSEEFDALFKERRRAIEQDV